jgi:hypothetical protein
LHPSLTTAVRPRRFTGNAIALFKQLDGRNSTSAVYASKRPAGGIWGSRALLSVAGAATAGARAVADTAGTFVVAWEDSTTQTLNVLTSPPGGGFAPAATFPGVLDLYATDGLTLGW